MSGFLGFLIPMLVVFFTLPILKSHLPAMEFGLNHASGQLVNYLTIFEFAFEMLLIRFVLDARRRGQQSFWNIMTALLVMLVGANAVLVLLAILFGKTLIVLFLGGLGSLALKQEILWLTLGYFMLNSINLFVYFKEAVEERYMRRNLIYMFNIGLGNILAAVLLVWQEDLRFVLVGKMIPSFISGLFFLLLHTRYIFAGFNKKLTLTAAFLIKYLKPGLLIRFNELFLSKSDIFLVQLMIGLEVFGGYANSYLISSSLFLMCKKVFEFSVNHFAARGQDVPAYFNKMFRASVEFMTLVFGGFLALSHDLINAWIPNRNEVEMQFIVPHLFFFFVQAISTVVLLNYLLAQNKIREYSRFSIFRNAFMLVSTALLIWLFQLKGMFLAFGLTALADMGLFIYFAEGTYKASLKKLTLPIMLALLLFPPAFYINSLHWDVSLVVSVLLKGSAFCAWFLLVGHLILKLQFLHMSNIKRMLFKPHDANI